jgi:redox-sensing transcriptional repressor
VRDPRREPSGDKPAPKAVVGRVSLYIRQLEVFQSQGARTVSSSQLGAALGINDAQVRKDLAFFGQFGYPGIGYRIEELIGELRRILGIDRDWPLALVGMGNLGRALLKYRGFRNRGFRIVALFDNDPRKIGHAFDGIVVRPVDALGEAIRGIFNFAPTPLVVPAHVSVVAVDLSVQLEHLAYQTQAVLGGISFIG